MNLERVGRTVKQLRILVVDDEALLRLDLSEMLIERGHDVVGEADNGADAIRLARELHPDLIMMDVKMPGMSGLEAAKTIGEEQLAPVLLLTAYSQQDVVEQATDSGVMAYLVKPIREEELTPAIEIALNRWNYYQELARELDKAKDDLETRRLLDRAKGILMDQHGFSEHDAFQAMQKLSMDRRLSLKAVAQAVLAAAEINSKAGSGSKGRRRK
jgi:two-component system, response regulator PdtaR